MNIKALLKRCSVVGCWRKADAAMIVHGNRVPICDACAEMLQGNCYASDRPFEIIRRQLTRDMFKEIYEDAEVKGD